MDAPRHVDILGIGEPFATRWRLSLVFGLLAYAGYRLVNPAIARQFDFSTQIHYSIPVYYGPAALLMLALFALHKRFCFPDIHFVGNIRRKDVIRGMLAVSVLYIAAYSTAYCLGQPREAAMASLYSLKTPTQNVVMVISLLALPPIVEELTFRHFLLSTLPFKASRKIAIAAVVATAFLFSVQHRHYDYLTTYLLLFTLGVVFSRARIRTDGVVLPIALHSYAVAFALICDRVVAHIQG
ncbi:CPBP family glutamic-type intramembrane protease [Paraburkholderia caffeinilytica]|uniref:CPBP family glutamic-type intramembrane protease n=1 Tax=Paraburkholderia caffeinilytica TaxID=1761016 RepID=UPI003DA0A720